jgi:hypothetical protein
MLDMVFSIAVFVAAIWKLMQEFQCTPDHSSPSRQNYGKAHSCVPVASSNKGQWKAINRNERINHLNLDFVVRAANTSLHNISLACEIFRACEFSTFHPGMDTLKLVFGFVNR